MSPRDACRTKKLDRCGYRSMMTIEKSTVPRITTYLSCNGSGLSTDITRMQVGQRRLQEAFRTRRRWMISAPQARGGTKHTSLDLQSRPFRGPLTARMSYLSEARFKVDIQILEPRSSDTDRFPPVDLTGAGA